MNKSLSSNAVFNFIKTLCGLLFPVITFTYSVRVLGAEGVGQVNFTNSIVTYFSMLAMLGMNSYGTREAAKLRDSPDLLGCFVHEALAINAVTTILAYAFFLLAICAVPRLRSYRTLLLIFSAAIPLQSMGMEWLYQAMEEYRYIAVRSICFQIGALAALFVFVQKPEDIPAYALIHMLARSGPYFLNFFHARKYVRFRRYEEYNIRRHLRPLLWLFAMVLSIELYTVLDKTMLGFLQGDAAVGRYTAAVKVNGITNSIITSLGFVLIPRLSYYIGRKETAKLEKLVIRAYNYAFLLSVPCVVGLFCLSKEIILLLCGEEFLSAAFTMRIMTPIVFVIPFSVVTNLQLFVPMNEEKRIVASTCVGACINLTCNAILIPRYAENGAAIGTVFAETAVTAVCFYNAGKFYDIREIFRHIWQYVLAALPIPLIAWLAQRFLSGSLWVCFMVIPLSGAAYSAGLLFLHNPYCVEIVRIYFRKFLVRRRPDML